MINLEAALSSSQSITFESAFSDRLPKWLLPRLTLLGFLHPTPVQAAALPLALPSLTSKGRDVVIHAQTGSGKTLAYLLPAIASIDPTRASTQALFIVPTQELGMQVYKLLRRLVSPYGHAGNGKNNDNGDDNDDDARGNDLVESAQSSFPVLPMLDQADLRRQKLQLRQAAPRAVVGNPHRIAALVNSGRLRLDLLKVLVVDEFDACLKDTTTINALQTILSVRGREGPRQTILVSATVPQHRHFLRQCVRQRWTQPDIKHIWVEEKSGERVPPSLTHWYAVCDGQKKLAALRALLVKLNAGNGSGEGTTRFMIRAIVFLMPSRQIEDIVDALNRSLEQCYGAHMANAVVGLTNDLSIVHRRGIMDRFRAGEARVLICTDFAARGLDIPDITHIFHFDLPTDPDSYLHRAGRAGRQGRPGSSVVLVTPGEQFVIRRTENALGIEFARIGR